MNEYRLVVLHEGKRDPTETLMVARAQEVTSALQELLQRHPDCHRIRVETAMGLLFAVDCHGEAAE